MSIREKLKRIQYLKDMLKKSIEGYHNKFDDSGFIRAVAANDESILKGKIADKSWYDMMREMLADPDITTSAIDTAISCNDPILKLQLLYQHEKTGFLNEYQLKRLRGDSSSMVCDFACKFDKLRKSIRLHKSDFSHLGYDDSSEDYYDDLDDAIDHHNIQANRNMESYGDIDTEDYDVVSRKPHELLPKSELKLESGWLKKHPKEQWSQKLKEVHDRDFSHIIDKKSKGELSPPISINGDLADGYGRTHLAHALGEDVPVMEFKRESLNKSDSIKGGLADNMPANSFDIKQLLMGITIEREHTDSDKLAMEIAKDHLSEDPNYYTKLREMESKPLKKSTKLAKASKKQMKTMLGDDPNGADIANWASNVLKRDDLQIWFLRNYKKDPSIWSNKTRTDLEHHLSMFEHIPSLKELRFSKDHSFEDGIKMLKETEESGQKELTSKSKYVPASGKMIKDVGNGYAWFDLGVGSCDAEAKAMGHCGNKPSQVAGDRLLSLRKVHNIGGTKVHEPALTFVENRGYLGEMKGRANEKPNPKYHGAIAALISDPKIKGVIGGGYEAHNNFELRDLDKDLLRKVIEANPQLAKIRTPFDKREPIDHVPDDMPRKFAAEYDKHNGLLEEHDSIHDVDDEDELNDYLRFRDIPSQDIHDHYINNDDLYNNDINAHLHINHNNNDVIKTNPDYYTKDHHLNNITDAFARSKYFEPRHFDNFFNSGDEDREEAAANSKHFKPEHADAAMNHKNSNVVGAYVISKHFKPEHADAAMNHKNSNVIYDYINSEHFRPEHADVAMNHRNSDVRYAYVNSKHFKPEHVDVAMNDEDTDVRDSAKKRAEEFNPPKPEGLNKAYFLNNRAFPEKSDKTKPHPTDRSKVGHISKTGDAVWAYHPNITKSHISNIRNNFDNLKLSDQGKQKLAGLISLVYNDPDHGVVSSGTSIGHKGKFSEVRMRHLSNAISGKGGARIEEDSTGVHIHVPRHSTNPNSKNHSTSWHFDGKKLKSFHKDPIGNITAQGEIDV